ncbi:MAG: glycine hydroxymethyltransferase, partial [Verrucomicrobiae bacterium]|nr:glycine hydroxymethyltransferase [Verrucomicrobiae bacterium]
MTTVLFICTGNVCRSPMAEGLFRHLTKDRGEFRILSAGVGAVSGMRPSGHAINAMQELGIDISQQRSRALTTGLIREADLVFGMTQGHVDSIALMHPEAIEKTFLLRHFEEGVPRYERDVADPIGAPLEVYRVCRDQIHRAIKTMLKHIDSDAADSGANPSGGTPSTPTVAIGSDHAGFELK